MAEAGSARLLEGHEADVALPPASVVKAVTALYALDTLGPAHRFGTWVTATGPVVEGRVEGDLILLGGGDPTLDTDALGDLAAALHARGVRRVAGRFLVQGGALPSFGRIDADQPDHVGYNPPISGLNLNFNRVHFRWDRSGGGHRAIMDAPGQRHNAAVSMARMQIVARNLPVYTYQGGDGVDHWTVAQSALGNSGSRWLPVRHPELYAGDVFRGLAAARGIELPAATRAPASTPRGTVLAEHASPPLAEIAAGMMRWSTNLTAEVLGLAAAQARGLRPASLAESATAMARWTAGAFGVGAFTLVDHSGLGDRSRMAPAQMARLLADARVEARLRGIMRDIPMRDGRGNPMPNHPVEVAAKTGTLNFVSGLAGYVRKPSGPDLVFAVFAADLATRARIPPDQRERPAGARDWSGRARRLQQQLIERWATVYA